MVGWCRCIEKFREDPDNFKYKKLYKEDLPREEDCIIPQEDEDEYKI
jgi:hypothetical protein